MASLRQHLERARERLAAAGIEQPAREAALLLRTLLGMSEAALLAHDHETLPADLAEPFAARVDRRARRVPAAYVLGEREFYGRPFGVDERVLIPRPETEQLAAIALSLPLPASARVLDLACGSGCLAVTLAAERPAWRVVATDLSLAALAVARNNAIRHGVARRVEFVAADLTRGLTLPSYDLVVTNPPYVDASDRDTLAPEVRDNEPAIALFAGEGGLAFYARLLRELATLPPGAWLACEHGAGQGSAIAALAVGAGGWCLEQRHDDLAGLDRNLVWRRMA